MKCVSRRDVCVCIYLSVHVCMRVYFRERGGGAGKVNILGGDSFSHVKKMYMNKEYNS